VAFASVTCAEFEVRNEWQKQNIIVISKFFLFLFDSNDVSATNAFEKVTVTGDESNNSGVWRRSPQPLEANGGLGAELQRCENFTLFSKNKAFLCIFWSKFLLYVVDLPMLLKLKFATHPHALSGFLITSFELDVLLCSVSVTPIQHRSCSVCMTFVRLGHHNG